MLLAYTPDRDRCVWEPGPRPGPDSLTALSAAVTVLARRAATVAGSAHVIFSVPVLFGTGDRDLCVLKGAFKATLRY